MFCNLVASLCNVILSKSLTEEQLTTVGSFNRTHPVFRRRLSAVFRRFLEILQFTSWDAGERMQESMGKAPTEPRATLLVVDDEASVRRVLVMRLQLAGYRVVCAEDGEQALEMFHREQPDLVAALRQARHFDLAVAALPHPHRRARQQP